MKYQYPVYIYTLVLILSFFSNDNIFAQTNTDSLDLPAGIRLISSNDNMKPQSVIADHKGNILIGGLKYLGSEPKFNRIPAAVFLEKYGTNGKIWESEYGLDKSDSYGDSNVRAVVTDKAGDVYLLGDVGSLNGQCYIVKFDQDGQNKWSKRFGPLSRICIAKTAVTDDNRNILVAGISDGLLDSKSISGHANYIFIQKYSTSGLLIWQRQYDTKEINYSVHSMTSIKDGSIYLTGWYRNGEGLFLMKLDDQGNKVWVKTEELKLPTMAVSIINDENNNVYVAGYTNGSVSKNLNNGQADVFVIKFNERGNMIWSRMVGSSRSEIIYSMKKDKKGNIWLIGNTEGYLLGADIRNKISWDYFIAIYDENGVRLTLKQFGSTNVDMALDAAFDNSGDLFIVGSYNNRSVLLKIHDIELVK